MKKMRQRDVGKVVMKFFLNKDVCGKGADAHRAGRLIATTVWTGVPGNEFHTEADVQALLSREMEGGFVECGGNDYPMSAIHKIDLFRTPWFMEVWI
ncbi:MAG: hypothetical protein KAJ19_30070 [Gammaproteobacteria bacterium]|nr:hypothetical protein [Gammaproteobacteria bacterium]